MSYAGSFGGLFVIYLKIEQAHSSFHKGDQADGFCQCPSFQVVLKPVNKLSTRGQSHARLINNTQGFCKWKTINRTIKMNELLCTVVTFIRCCFAGAHTDYSL